MTIDRHTYPLSSGRRVDPQEVVGVWRAGHQPLLADPSAGAEGIGMIDRRRIFQFAIGAALVPVNSGSARAQGYPTQPVRIIVGFPPAGGADISARLIGQWLSKRLGQPFVIENRPGAATNLATAAVVRAPADGHTLLLAFTSNAINASLYDKLNYNFVADTTPIAGIMRTPLIMAVNASFPAKTVPEFIAYAKANPSKLNMASGGNGALGHVSGELFKSMTNVEMVHVPYRGDADAITDLLAGRVQVHFAGIASAIGFINAGTLRGLAVTTANRSQALPQIPAMSEFLSSYEASAWFGLCAPKNTPETIVNELNGLVNSSLADPAIIEKIASLGGEVLVGSPADFGRLIADETAKWAQAVRLSGAKLQ